MTDKTIMLSDLRAEIKPRGVINLEMIADRSAIEKSHDLYNAMRSKRLQLGKHTVIRVDAPNPIKEYIKIPVATPNPLDEQKLASLIKSVIKEEMRPSNSDEMKADIQKTVAESIDSLHRSIREQINSIKISEKISEIASKELNIDPEKLAEISQRSIEKISDEITSSEDKQLGKKHKLNAGNLKKLADEI